MPPRLLPSRIVWGDVRCSAAIRPRIWWTTAKTSPQLNRCSTAVRPLVWTTTSTWSPAWPVGSTRISSLFSSYESDGGWRPGLKTNTRSTAGFGTLHQTEWLLIYCHEVKIFTVVFIVIHQRTRSWPRVLDLDVGVLTSELAVRSFYFSCLQFMLLWLNLWFFTSTTGETCTRAK